MQGLLTAPPDGLVCEFGVANGVSIGWIAGMLPHATIHGFDSFEGFPEDGGRPGWEKGMLACPLPVVPDNVSLHVGLFQATLPGFLKEHSSPLAFIHLDADLYTSTKYVLDALRDRIQPGTVIKFDQFWLFPKWQFLGEGRAMAEFCLEFGRDAVCLGRSAELALFQMIN